MRIPIKILDIIRGLFGRRARMHGSWGHPPTLRIATFPIRNQSGYASNPGVMEEFLKRPPNQRCVVLGFPERDAGAKIINEGAYELAFNRQGIEVAGFVRNVDRGVAEIEIFDTAGGREILRRLGTTTVPCEACGVGHLVGEGLHMVFDHISFVCILS